MLFGRDLTEKEKDEIIIRGDINCRLLRSNIPVRYRSNCMIDDYNVSNDKQKEVLGICKDFAFKKMYSNLIMSGKNGTGKTMLCSILLKEMIVKAVNDRVQDPGGRIGVYKSSKFECLYTEAIKMIRLIKDSWRNKTSEQEAIDVFIKPDVLVIDELGMQYESSVEVQFITEIINDRYNQRKGTILSGNLTVDEISKMIGDRVVDRFKENGKVLVFDWESFRGKK